MTRFAGSFDAGVAMAAKIDLYSFFMRASPELRAARKYDYGDPVINADRFRALSPVTYANRVRDPILLVLGGQDPKVSLSDADEFVRRLRRRKQDVSLEIVPALGHKTETPDEISLADARIVDFFAEKLDANTGLQ